MNKPQSGHNTESANNQQSPGLFRRLAAMFYDSLLALAIAFAMTALVILLRVLVEGDSAIKEGEQALQGSYLFILQILILSALCGFFCWFWTKTGQTLGMQAWRLRIDNNIDPKNNSRISTKQALIRFFGAIISAVCFGLGYAWILVDRHKRSWHDYWSDSRVVLLPKKKKK